MQPEGCSCGPIIDSSTTVKKRLFGSQYDALYSDEIKYPFHPSFHQRWERILVIHLRLHYIDVGGFFALAARQSDPFANEDVEPKGVVDVRRVLKRGI